MEIVRSRWFLFSFLALLVQAQDQSGFLSLDCGLPADSQNYTEQDTKIKYISDAGYINIGEIRSISSQYKSMNQQQLWNLRSFSQETRNCYNISIVRGTKYLIRAHFFYGNYDGLDEFPVFDLYLGDTLWKRLKWNDYTEIIHVPSTDKLLICLINIGRGTPFISALELRQFPNSTYPTTYGSLYLDQRWDLGSKKFIDYRFPYDLYDRIWSTSSYNDYGNGQINTSDTVNPGSEYHPAAIVMQTATTPKSGSKDINFSWIADPSAQYYVYPHFSELEKLQSNQFRGFNRTHNGDHWYGPIIPDYLRTTTFYSKEPVPSSTVHYLSFRPINNSTLPPIINGLEIYYVMKISELESNPGDVDAISNIRSTYGVIKNWQGDPCVPRRYPWSGLHCSTETDSVPKIISLNLTSSGLKGDISPHISSLAMLQTLDLSNNFLTGKVPDFLSNMSHLQILKLENNNLTGSLPPELIKRMKNGSLNISIQGNPNLDQCMSDQCTKETQTLEKKSSNNNLIIPVVASVGGLIAILIIAGIVCWITKSKKQGTVGSQMATRSQRFTYAEVLRMTNNFERILGEGGSGIIYYGVEGDIQVAVKMISASAIQRNNQFQAEVTILMRVHHKNLTSLVGYLNEGGHLGLIYEYMANGNLAQHLSERSSSIFSWEERLRIAIDAAQGLEYLHHGCKPPIIHRDVKTTNILLTEDFQAKLSDFGLSKSYPTGDKSYMTTVVVGTRGYLDPEYYTSNRLTEKSDVYSFGISLMEIISCRPVIPKIEDENSTYIAKWVCSMVEQGDIKNIVDPRLKGVYETDSALKAVLVALGCVSANPGERPTMSQVVADLNDCLVMELSQRSESRPLDSKESIEMMPISMIATHTNPMAR